MVYERHEPAVTAVGPAVSHGFQHQSEPTTAQLARGRGLWRHFRRYGGRRCAGYSITEISTRTGCANRRSGAGLYSERLGSSKKTRIVGERSAIRKRR